MAEFFSDNLTDRQVQTVLHTMKFIGSKPEDVMYLKSEEYVNDTFPIDLAIFKPNENIDCYVMQTVGLSSYYFEKDVARSELVMVLPKKWKADFDKAEYNWPRLLLLDIAYGLVDNKRGPMIGQVHLPKDEEVYEGSPDIVGGIVVLPEDFDIEFCEEYIDESYTRFLQIVPVSKDDLSKIEEVGPGKFIEYDLHDSDGAQFIAKLKEKKIEGIDKIIKQNEDSLKD